MSSLFTDLSWLKPAPADFSAQCQATSASSGERGNQIRALATHSLDENQLVRLARTMDRIRTGGGSLAPLDELRLSIVSNATSDFIAPAIAASAARHGVALKVTTGDYAQVLQAVLSPDSSIYASKPHAVLIATDYRWLPFAVCPGNAEEAARVIEACLSQMETLRAGVKQNSSAVCIFQTLAPPVETLFGSLDRALPGTLLAMIDSFNAQLARRVAGTEDLLLDVAGMANIVGLAEWHDVTTWNMAKIPFSHRFLPLYGDHVGRLLGALRGKSRRCLILDLDNTVWGGVIGDDGLEGIKIAQGDATGEAHLDVQRLALALRSRGVVLAVSSKNTDQVARQPFLEHPEMLLKLDHIAVFQANWRDKATNIKAIADELSLGLESMVFLDDNPMERDLVRQMLPAVAVPELPSDPALFARTLLAAGYFESSRFSLEDMARAEFYQDNSRRVALQQAAGDLGSYLASLDMEITFQPFDQTGMSRIAQLISKSNQFNLTTRRYSEVELAKVQSDPNAHHLQIRLKDTFGDNGMISVVICKPVDDSTLEFDTWLMSCRVLGRKVEQAVLQEVVEYAGRRHFKRLVGRYIPTSRNALVKDHYEKLGFDKLETLEDGTTLWQLDVASFPLVDVPMKVIHLGTAADQQLTQVA